MNVQGVVRDISWMMQRMRWHSGPTMESGRFYMELGGPVYGKDLVDKVKLCLRSRFPIILFLLSICKLTT